MAFGNQGLSFQPGTNFISGQSVTGSQSSTYQFSLASSQPKTNMTLKITGYTTNASSPGTWSIQLSSFTTTDGKIHTKDNLNY